jgi:hypothetical protein
MDGLIYFVLDPGVAPLKARSGIFFGKIPLGFAVSPFDNGDYKLDKTRLIELQ